MPRDWFVRGLAVGLFALAGCENPVANDSLDIIGSWRQATQQLSPAGTYEFSVSFNADGQFVADGRMYGVYPGQPSKELSAYNRTEGSYRTEQGRLILNPQRLTVWDRFYGANSPERVDEPYPYSGYFDNAKYELNGDILTLRYTIYPADAPEPTTMKLVRRE